MKRVLLTGATGLIGKYAIEPLIQAGFEVFALSSEIQSTKENINWVKANLLELNEIKEVFEQIKPQYLLHFAWNTTPPDYLESPLNFDWMDSSIEMLKQFKSNGGKRAIFAGTCFEYRFSNELLKENSPLEPVSTYAKCKNRLREEASEYCFQNGIEFGWGRIFYVYGEREHPQRLFPKAIETLSKDKEFIVYGGESVRDYMFAQDIAEAFVKFLDSDLTGEMNICSGKPAKISDIALLIAKKLHKEHLLRFAPANAPQPETILGDCTRLKKELDFTPKFEMEDVLDKLIP